MVQLIRPIASAVIVGVLTYSFLMLWMHAPAFFALFPAAVLGVLVLAISGSGSTARDAAADEAWMAAAPDLPPYAERREMERDQEALPGPAGAQRASRGGGRSRPDASRLAGPDARS